MPKDEEAEGKGGEGKTADAKDAKGQGDDGFTDEQLVEKVQEFFYADEELAKTFEGACFHLFLASCFFCLYSPLTFIPIISIVLQIFPRVRQKTSTYC